MDKTDNKLSNTATPLRKRTYNKNSGGLSLTLTPDKTPKGPNHAVSDLLTDGVINEVKEGGRGLDSKAAAQTSGSKQGRGINIR